MTVVSTRVHFAREDRSIWQTGRFLNIECVNVGPQANGADFTRCGKPTCNRTYDASFCQATGDRNAHFREPRRDEFRRKRFFECSLRMFVQLPTPKGQLGMDFANSGGDRHSGHSCGTKG